MKKKTIWLSMMLAGCLGFSLPHGEAAEIRNGTADEKEILATDEGTDVDSWSQPGLERAAKKSGEQAAEKTGETETETARQVISNVPVKTPFKPKTREVELQLQRGQLVSEAIGDVDGDGHEEIVDLMGSPIVDKSSFMGDMYLIVRDVGKKDVKYFIRPKNLGGYDAYITLADVTGSSALNVIVAAPTGGSSGMVDYRIIDFTGAKPQEIFTAADNKGVQIVGNYLPDYRARLQFPGLPGQTQEVIVDLSRNKDAYHTLNVYDDEGQVVPSGQRPYAQGISQLTAMDTNGDGINAIVTTQKVLGVINSEPLGYVRTVLAYRAGVWQPQDVSFRTALYTKPAYENTGSVTGKSGYEIVSLPIETAVGNLEYPHFQKMDPKIAWKMNHRIEMFFRDRIRSAGYASRLHLAYDVKYAGSHYVSIFVMGLYSDHEISEPIMQGFNFDVRTGEEVPLKDLVRPQGRFWRSVSEAAEKKGITIREKDVTGYYYDGTVLGLLYGNHREFDLAEDEVMPYLLKNRVNEEFLTNQSNEENGKKEKKAEGKEK